jgi:hypothetical protein
MASTPVCRSVAVVLLVIAAATPAAGQGRDPRPVSVGAAAGVSVPLHGDLDFTAPSWQADVRVDAARHVGFSVFYEQWQRGHEQVRTDQTITGPNGPLGRVDRVEIRTDHTTRALGWSVLGRGTASRAIIHGGGGISYLAYTRDFTQTLTGCTPVTLCRDTRQTFENSSFAAQLQAGVDVAVSRYLAVTGQYRVILPVRDPAGGHSSVMGGIRVVF